MLPHKTNEIAQQDKSESVISAPLLPPGRGRNTGRRSTPSPPDPGFFLMSIATLAPQGVAPLRAYPQKRPQAALYSSAG